MTWRPIQASISSIAKSLVQTMAAGGILTS